MSKHHNHKFSHSRVHGKQRRSDPHESFNSCRSVSLDPANGLLARITQKVKEVNDPLSVQADEFAGRLGQPSSTPDSIKKCIAVPPQRPSRFYGLRKG
jgi:hypothetical protein